MFKIYFFIFLLIVIIYFAITFIYHKVKYNNILNTNTLTEEEKLTIKLSIFESILCNEHFNILDIIKKNRRLKNIIFQHGFVNEKKDFENIYNKILTNIHKLENDLSLYESIYYKNIEESAKYKNIDCLKSELNLIESEIHKFKTSSAYDLSRLIMLVRYYYTKNILTEEESLEYINTIKQKISLLFNSFEKFKISYLIGLAYDINEFDFKVYLKKIKKVLGNIDTNEFSSLFQKHKNIDSKDTRDLLSFGAFYCNYKFESYNELKLTDYFNHEPILTDKEINSPEMANKYIDSLINNYDINDKDTFITKKIATETSGEVISKYIKLKEKIIEIFNFTEDDFINCDTLGAFYLEIASYEIRKYYTIGYFSENESYDFLSTICTKSQYLFNNWKEYFISFIIGIIFSEFIEDLYAYIYRNEIFVKSNESIINKLPLNKIDLDKYLFWDFDGTLAYRQGGWSGTIKELLDENNHSVSIEEINKKLHSGFPWNFPNTPHRILFRGKTWWEYMSDYFNDLFKSFNLSIYESRRLSERVQNKYLDKKHWFLYDDTINALESAINKGYKNIILCNHVPEVKELIEDLGISKYFLTVYNSADIGFEKPNKNFYDFVLSEIPDNSKIYMIGNDYHGDYLGAKKYGIKPLYLKRNSTEENEYTINSLKDESIFKKLISQSNH